MGCHAPLPAYRSLLSGAVSLREPLDADHQPPRYEYLRLPCGNCLGCRFSRAREWAFRCKLELSDHEHATFVTLTYDDEHLPYTLDRQHLSDYLKRLRHRIHPRRVRFFASGEYGEQNRRPHYHAILFGLSVNDAPAIRSAWSFGFVDIKPITPGRIKYVAGYTQKKAGRTPKGERIEIVDDFGEVHSVPYQPPFIQMSRNPGIGSTARKYHTSWKLHAVDDGKPIPVPRYLHAAWIKQTTPEQHQELKDYKASLPRPLMDKHALLAAKLDAETRLEHKKLRRTL